MVLKWNGAKLKREIKLDKNNNCGLIQSSPMCAGHYKFVNAMNRRLLTCRYPGYHPVTPFNFEVDQE